MPSPTLQCPLGGGRNSGTVPRLWPVSANLPRTEHKKVAVPTRLLGRAALSVARNWRQSGGTGGTSTE
eukprot:734944-Alexandrium_andersonii.AAC.1